MNPIRASVPHLETKEAYFRQSWYVCRGCKCDWNGTWPGSAYGRPTAEEPGTIGGWCKACVDRQNPGERQLNIKFQH